MKTHFLSLTSSRLLITRICRKFCEAALSELCSIDYYEVRVPVHLQRSWGFCICTSSRRAQHA